MVGNKNKFVYIIVLAFLLVLPFTLGANILDQILKPFEGIDFGQTYSDYYPFVDGIIYFWLFIAIARSTLGKVFPDTKAIPTAIGVMLGIGMVVFEFNSPSEFNLGKLGPIAFIILISMLGVAAYKTIKSTAGEENQGVTLTAMSAAFLLVFVLLNYMSPETVEVIEKNSMTVLVWQTMFLLSLGGIIIGMIRLVPSIRSGSEFKPPSGPMRKDAETFFPNQEKQIEQAENITSGLESEAKDDLTQKEIVKEEKGLEDFDEYENVLDAEGEKFAQDLEKAGKEEAEAEQKEAEMLTAINGYGDNIDKQLKGMQSTGVMDKVGKAYIMNNIRGISKICMSIAQRKQEENFKRKQSMEKLNEDIQNITKVLDHFKKITNGLKNVNTKIGAAVNTDLIAKVEAEIKKKNRQLKVAWNKLNNKNITNELIRDKQREMIARLEGEVAENEKVLKELLGMKEVVEYATSILKKTIDDLRKDMKQLDSIAKQIKSQDQNTLLFLKNFDTEVNKILEASAKFNLDINELENSEILEEIPVSAATNVGIVYERMISIELLLKKFYEEEINPFIKDIKNIEIYSSRFNDPIKKIQQDILDIQGGYNTMKQAAAKILDTESSKDINIEKKMVQIAKTMKQIMASENAARTTITNNTLDVLNRLEQKIINDIQKINAEIQNLQTSEKLVIDKLSKSLEIIVKNKSRINKEFEQKAEQFKENMASASKNVMDADKKIK